MSLLFLKPGSFLLTVGNLGGMQSSDWPLVLHLLVTNMPDEPDCAPIQAVVRLRLMQLCDRQVL